MRAASESRGPVPTDAGPRWSLAVLSAFIAVCLAWAARVLPWRTFTPFVVVTLALAVVHGITALACVAASPHRRFAWRVQSMAALAYLVWLAVEIGVSAAHLAQLYGGLGSGVGVVMIAAGIVVATLVLPAALWCFASVGRPRLGRRGAIALSIAAVALVLGARRTAESANALRLFSEDAPALQRVLAEAIPTSTMRGGSLMTRAAAECAAPPDADVVTILAAFDGAEGAVTACVQAPDLAGAIASLRGLLGEKPRGRVAIDVVTARRELVAVDPVVDLLALRPGLDGVCEGTRCLAPWQLVAMHSFSAIAPLDLLHELRIGIDPRALRTALRPERAASSASVDGLVRIETASFATDATGELHALRRLRVAGPALDPGSLRAAVRAAEDYIAAAQLDDGRFEYRLDPFSGELSMESFSVARQAGTTLVMCELAEDRERARVVAQASLRMLSAATSRHGELAMLHDPVEPHEAPRWFDLGDTALGAAAFLSCRPLVGDAFDAEIDGLTRFLLAMQRDDGSFHPEFDLARGEVVRGPEPLFAVGQAVLALVLLEELVVTQPDRFVASDPLHRAVESAMDYVTHDYWSGFGAQFFYMEENWHCLAARAALAVHRHDGYETFCVDYVRWKTRLVLDESDGVDADWVGGYGFGNVVPPWSSGSATFGEAAAAALSIMQARGLEPAVVSTRLELALAFLVHHQWKDAECFACSAAHPIAGAWSEHAAAPTIRIDYVQHAMGALGHGGRALGWL